MPTLGILIQARDEASAVLKAFGGKLDRLASKGQTDLVKLSAAAQTLTPAFAIAGAGMTAALGGAIAAAAGFEHTMSGVKAVMAPAEVQQFGGALEKLALTLGKETAFSAKEAAAGIEELIKGGVTAEDVLAGAARSTLALAAAGGVSLPEAATIAANALAQFSLKGEDMAHVADLIAGAANASAIGVGDFKFSLQAAGAVAATVGFSFDDLAQAIAVMGKAGIAGSDAGTSLKTMMLNLIPSTAEQKKLFRELGLTTDNLAAGLDAMRAKGVVPLTDDWPGLNAAMGEYLGFSPDVSKWTKEQGTEFEKFGFKIGTFGSAFFDANGKVKGMSEVAGVLQNALKGMTEQQRIATLEVMFGSDAIRAGAILAKEGAEGFDAMAEAMGKVSAEAVATARLDNLTGSFEQLKGSVETAAIVLGQQLIPLVRPLVDGITGLVNQFLELDPRWQQAIAFGALLATGLTLLAAAALGFLAILPAIISGVAAAGAIFGVVAGVLTGPVLLAIAAVVLAAIGLKLAWDHNTLGIRDAVAALWDFLTRTWDAMTGELARFGAEVLPELSEAWAAMTARAQEVWEVLEAFLRPALALLARDWTAKWEVMKGALIVVWEGIKLVVQVAWEIVKGIILAGLNVLQGDWQGAWDALRTAAERIWALIAAAVARALGAIGIDVGRLVEQVRGVVDAINSLLGGIRLPSFGGLIEAAEDAARRASQAVAGAVPRFQMGGVVPGPFGAPTLAVVHGGELVTPAGRAAAGAAAPPIHLTLLLDGQVLGRASWNHLKARNAEGAALGLA